MNTRPSAFLVAEHKITGYLLNVSHPVGGAKARFFIDMGFSPDRWEMLAEALREHAARNPIVKIEPTAFGTTYVVRCTLRTPNGRDPCIQSIWQEQHPASDAIRLVSAYPHG